MFTVIFSLVLSVGANFPDQIDPLTTPNSLLDGEWQKDVQNDSEKMLLSKIGLAMAQVALFPPYFFGMVFIHESAHAVAHLAYGDKITEFRPYPGMVFSKNEQKNIFVFGRIVVENDQRRTVGNSAMTALAPRIADVAMFTASDLALEYYVGTDSLAAPFLLTAGMICPLVDFAVGVNSQNPYSDTAMFSRYSGINKHMLVLTGNILALLGVARVGFRIYDIYLAEPKQVE